MNITERFHLTFLLTAAACMFTVGVAAATEVRFERTTYTVRPGDTVELKTAFSQPVPAGLEAYGLRLTFPEVAATLTPGNIFVPAALDHDLFAENPADRRVGPGYATVEGFTEFGQAPYSGTAFATFTLTIPPNAPGGTFALNLGLADSAGNNFVDGNMQVIDGQMIFGTASLVIEVDAPSVRVTEIAWVAGTAHLRLRFSGNPNATYRIEASTDLVAWSTLGTVVSQPNGSFEYTDENARQLPRRFYRAGPQ